MLYKFPLKQISFSNLGLMSKTEMKLLLIFCFLLFLFLASPKVERRSLRSKSYPCGVAALKNILKRRIEGRISNGWEAKRNSLPWVVAIFYKKDKFLKVSCGGSIISPEKANQTNFVLTAAHCLVTEKKEFDKANNYVVVAGLHDIREESNSAVQRARVKEYVRLDYDADIMQNDVSLLVLEKPLQFSDSVRPICLPKAPGTNIPSSKCYIAGWGIMKGEPSPVLQVADVKASDHAQCVRKYGHNFNVYQQICVVVPKGGSDADQGDSGGPMFCEVEAKYFLYGIVSYGPSRRSKISGSVYTRVSAFLWWIQEMLMSYSAARS